MKLRRAIFLDKDGTLICDEPYNVDPSLIRFTENATRGLCLLHDLGYRLIVVSNQSGVAHGYFQETALTAVEQRLRAMLAETCNIPLTGFYYCPHHLNGIVKQYAIACDCRKPAPGLLLRAAQEHHIDLIHSWLIGDILDDIEAGKHAGCRTILLDPERSEAASKDAGAVTTLREPDYRVANLDQAAQKILKENLREGGLQLVKGT